MPKLQDTRKIIKTNLITDPEVEVELRDGLLGGEVEEVEKATAKIDQSFLMLKFMIKKWNYTEGDGSMTPVTIENLKKLDIQDLNHLIEQVSFVKSFLAQQDNSNKK